MRFNIELPKKLNKINYFEKNEEGCTLVSHNGANSDVYIIVSYPMDIEKSFAITDSTLQAIVKLQPDVEVKLNEKSIVATSKRVDIQESILTMILQSLIQIMRIIVK